MPVESNHKSLKKMLWEILGQDELPTGEMLTAGLRVK